MKISLFFLIMFIAFGSYSQSELQQELEAEQDSSEYKISRIYYGGYLNLSFGSYTVIGAQPLVGYKISPQFSVGAQLSYEYFSDNTFAEKYSSSNYGASIFSRYRIVPQFYAHAEFSAMKYDISYYSVGNSREWVPFLFVGGGFSQPVSQNVWLNAQVLFDVIQNKNSPYKAWDPFYSIGFGVGF